MSTKANVWLCILFSTLCGISFTLSAALPAYYAHRDKKVKDITTEEEEKWEDEEGFKGGAREEGGESLQAFESVNKLDAKQEKTSACMWKLVSFMSIALQFLGLVFAYLSILFGPISIYAIVFTASYLLSGMLVMSYILGIEEKPNKDTRVGNYLIVVAAILVVANGPIISNKEFTPAELKELFFEKQSVIFLSACIILLLVTFPHHFIVMFSKKGADTFSDNVNFIMFQISLNLLALFNTITMKVIPSSQGWFFGLNLAFFIFIFLYYPVVSLVQNVVIKNPGVFLSISSAITYLVNVASGLLVWKDQIRNWTGYSCSIVIFLFGVYLITETDIIKGINEKWKKLNPTGDHRSSLVTSLEYQIKMDALPPNDPNRNNNNQNSHERKAKEDPRGPRNTRGNGRNEMEMFGGGNAGDEMMVAAIIFCGLASWLLREVCLC